MLNVCSLSYVEQRFCNPKDWSPPGSSAQEYWNGLPFPPPGDLPNPGIKPVSAALAGGFLTTEPLGKPRCIMKIQKSHIPWESGHPRSARAVCRCPQVSASPQRMTPRRLPSHMALLILKLAATARGAGSTDLWVMRAGPFPAQPSFLLSLGRGGHAL